MSCLGAPTIRGGALLTMVDVIDAIVLFVTYLPSLTNQCMHYLPSLTVSTIVERHSMNGGGPKLAILKEW
jgi:hypothetical protein